MSITITGISGFVGQNLHAYLKERQCETIGISLRKMDWEHDLKFDDKAIIHLAGKAHDTTNSSFDAEYFKVNRDLTIKLFDLYLQSDIRDFIYFSSVKAVADTLNEVLTEEQVEANPMTAYGRSKLEAERYILSKNIPFGKRVFILRPCMIHGPGNKGNLNLLFKLVKTGFPWPLAAFDNERSFLNIANLCYIIERLINDENIESGIYNVADDDSVSTNALVSLIAESLDKKEKLLYFPKGLVKGVARIGDVLPSPLNSERLKKLTESYVVSNSKIKQALGVERLPWSAKDGLRTTLKSFKSSK